MKKERQNGNGNGKGVEEPVEGAQENGNGVMEENAAESQPVVLSREEYDALVEEAARAKEQYLLAVADFENYRKRVEKEKEDIICFANEKLILDLLPILDNLERALSMEFDQAGANSILEGVRMVNGQLHSVLGSCGLVPVEAVGGAFDPQYHEAVGVLPSGGHDEGTVVSELQKGYSLKGKILRPSMVHVAGQSADGKNSDGDD